MKKLIPLAVILVGFAGCSTIDVDTDYDRSADFAAYRSFSFLSGPAVTRGPELSQLTDRRIRDAVTEALAAKGIEARAEGAQLLVTYQAGVRERTEFYDSGWSGGYRGYGYWPGYSRIETYTYAEGTLVVDLIDAARNQLVWRGRAVGVVGDYEGQEARIREAVAAMFEKYPPR